MADGLIHRKTLQLFLAVLLCTLTFSAAAELGLRVRDTPNAAGVEVTQVTPGSLAAEAGLKAGDIILQVEKNAVTSAEQFAQRVRSFPPGAPFSVRISREGWERDLMMKPVAAAVPTPKKFGLRLRDQAPDQPPGHGAQIVAVTPSSSAAGAGLKAGDVVTEVEGRRLSSASELVGKLREACDQNRSLSLTIAREGWEKSVLLAPAAMPAQADPAEWQSADQASDSTALQPARTAADTGARRAPSAGTPEHPQPHVATNLDDASYKAYTDDLEHAKTSYQNADWPAAERYYKQAIQRVPNDPGTWGMLGYALVMQQKYSEAASACNKSLALGVPQPSVLNNLGFSQMKLGAIPEAKAAYLKAIEVAPQWAQPYAGLGALHFNQQEWPLAERYYRLALEREPDNAANRQALEGVLRQQRRMSEFAPPQPAANRPNPGAAVAPAVMPDTLQRQNPEPLPQPRSAPAGRKAMVAVGDFQVKAAGAAPFIGDGMREMLVTTLHNSGNYIVVERMDLQGLAAEQALSRSRMARPGVAIPESQMDVAEIMVYAAVTEFEGAASGGGIQLGVTRLPLNLGRQTSNAHMAIDVRVVDVATGRLIAAQRLTGQAKSSQTTIGTNLSASGDIPLSLGAFKNTPMEQAIREVIQKATAYITSNTPQQYFRHQ
ncbi:CsgG/HfaB family protein [Sulfurimicrobium lacus]|nr:CsgG/HfaB family protein [Sulfurimicrobium lacus]